MHRRVALALLCVASTLVWLGGCQNARVNECNALIAAINQEQLGLKAASSQDPAEFERLAERLTAAAERVGAVNVTLEPLRKHRDAYRGFVEDIATYMRAAAQGLRERDSHKLDEARTREREIGEREDALVGALNAYCTGG